MPQKRAEGQNTKGPVDPAIVGTSDGPSSNSRNEAHLTVGHRGERPATVEPEQGGLATSG